MVFCFFFLKKGVCPLENGRMILFLFSYCLENRVLFMGYVLLEVCPLPSPKASLLRAAYAFRVVLDRYVAEMH